MPHRPTLACAALICATLIDAPAAAQGPDTTVVPAPPAARLAALAPFFGVFSHSDNYWAGAGPFRGTLEVGPAVKGWYVEWIINTHYGPIDRQLRMLTTWDEMLGRYRVWRFETLPQSPPGTIEAEGRFEGDEFIMEWKEFRGPQGQRGTFRNRIRMEGPDELVIISEVDPQVGETFQLAEWRNQRIITAGGGDGP